MAPPPAARSPGSAFRPSGTASWCSTPTATSSPTRRSRFPANAVGGVPVEDLINAGGFAYATTSYRANGLVADIAVNDLVLLEDLVRRTVRPDPDRVYIVGVSEGGLVAALGGGESGRPVHRRARGLRADR